MATTTKGMYFVEYGEYSEADDCCIWQKIECNTFEDCMSFVRSKFNTLTYTSFNQITYVEGDKKYDWEYLKKNNCDKYEIMYFDEDMENSVQPPSIA
tara:strand:- start:4762 stop:5052 length:291 start_codon:yes stop_codon:yes gene_type:complete